jgi:hypothetical protein
MSFFEDASLVLIPSAIKDQKVYSVKPTDGTGDLTFSRASDATRVASNGLIEKVRTNLALYSEQFDDAAYSKGTLTVSANAATAPNGTTTADLIYPSANSSNSVIFNGVTISSGVEYTNSVYVKASGKTWTFIRGINDANGAFFNLSSGTIGTTQPGVSATITSIGSGWYRCSVTQTSTSTTGRLVILVVDGNGSSAVTANGTDGLLIWGAQQEAGVMTDYIPTTSAAVSVGPVSGLPRLDYLNSSCPRLLLEPSSTTLLPFSEQLDNAAWDKTSGGAAITANSVTSPDGYTNADTITGTGASVAFVLVRQTISVASAGTYTFSGFFKYNNHPFVSLNLSAYDGGGNANYNIQTGVVTNVSAGSTAKIENYGNGWYRCSLTSAIGATDLTGRPSIYVAYDGTTSDFPSTAEATGKAVYAWGFNMCLGSYVQSYLPTLSTSVTRLAETASKTGITSLIGQTEGTLFAEFTPTSNENAEVVQMYANTSLDNVVSIGCGSGNIYGVVYTASSYRFQPSISRTIPNNTFKVAICYKNNDFAFFINGEKVAQSSNSYVPTAPLTGIYLAEPLFLAKNTINYKSVLTFPVRLTDTQAIELTA